MAEDRTDSDLVWGAESIGAVIGRTAKQTYHLLENKRLPARKIGDQWVANRRALKSIAPDGEAA